MDPGPRSRFSHSSPETLSLDIYLPRDEVLELLDLLVGLWVLLQVPLCKEGLEETGRATENTRSQHALLHTCRVPGPGDRARRKANPQPCGHRAPSAPAGSSQHLRRSVQRGHTTKRHEGAARRGIRVAPQAWEPSRPTAEPGWLGPLGGSSSAAHMPVTTPSSPGTLSPSTPHLTAARPERPPMPRAINHP